MTLSRYVLSWSGALLSHCGLVSLGQRTCGFLPTFLLGYISCSPQVSVYGSLSNHWCHWTTTCFRSMDTRRATRVLIVGSGGYGIGVAGAYLPGR
ncbi:hypothetical protein GY45DRAFT_176971 [Cubamyces sp. BRFM 1775]|nr:hypothetical protein GY45DRAFT_544713 [Cubamyces sp. BRFM 1775]KAI0325845.1 hypothetical protein GY45DRAFT_176971 [Cubamyces sp. BRFM 1775]